MPTNLGRINALITSRNRRDAQIVKSQQTSATPESAVEKTRGGPIIRPVNPEETVRVPHSTRGTVVAPPKARGPAPSEAVAAPPAAEPKPGVSKAATGASRKQRDFMPMFWNGMGLSAWLRLLAKNRFRLGWQWWYMLPMVTLYATFHSLLRGYQWLVAGYWRVGKTLDSSPLFIVGHWRSGTTLLHELLVLDSRHTFPTTYECFAPQHFLISEPFGTRLFKFLVPARRPMDNMAAGWDRPQEDEFALCNMGLPSPYLTVAFPNEAPQDPEYLTLKDVPPAELRRWKQVFSRYLLEINARTPKRIVLKSPPHTARIKVLLEMFPNAKFVHIVRDPFVIFPSTVHLWKRLYASQAMQRPNFEGLEEYVFDTLVRMYDSFEADRHLIPPENFCQVRYEDLVADPMGKMRDVYQALDLGGFADVRPAIENYLGQTRNYETNKYAAMPPELRAEIARRWQKYARTYGYPTE